jgi:hypothetical protein
VLFERQKLSHDVQLRGVVGRGCDHPGELLVQVVGHFDDLLSLGVMRNDVFESLQRSAR